MNSESAIVPATLVLPRHPKARAIKWAIGFAIYLIAKIQLAGSGLDFVLAFAELVAFFSGLIMLPSRVTRTKGAFFCLAGFLSQFLPMLAVEFQQRLSIERAHPIIKQIEQFKLDTGKYPQSLDDLVPRYLASIPRAHLGVLGTRFFYARFEKSVVPPHGENYCLTFKAATLSQRGKSYRSDLGRWTTIKR